MYHEVCRSPSIFCLARARARSHPLRLARPNVRREEDKCPHPAAYPLHRYAAAGGAEKSHTVEASVVPLAVSVGRWSRSGHNFRPVKGSEAGLLVSVWSQPSQTQPDRRVSVFADRAGVTLSALSLLLIMAAATCGRFGDRTSRVALREATSCALHRIFPSVRVGSSCAP